MIFILMSIEVMLNAAGLAFVVAGARWGQPDGQIMFLFILAMAAAEVSVGLALVLRIYHQLPVAGCGRHQQDERLRCSNCSGWFRQSRSRAPSCLRSSGRAFPQERIGGRLGVDRRIGHHFRPDRRRVPDASPGNGDVHQTLDVARRRLASARRSRFYLDALSLVMMLVVTFVSFLIHLYSTEFMADDEATAASSPT